MDTQEQVICRLCLEPIYRYCHSAMGSIRAYAWTTVAEDAEDDQRYGTRCYYGGTLQAFQHDPDYQEQES